MLRKCLPSTCMRHFISWIAAMTKRLALAETLAQSPLEAEQPMPAIDYEVEYNNRARVPEHPEIFARWTRDAELYRLKAMEERRAELGLAYGESPRQTVDIFWPDAGRKAPLALFIHGGYWRSLDPSMFSHMAKGLNGRGIAVAVAGYDLCPQVTIAEIIDEMRHACLFLWQRTGQHLMVFGHSAGGHLAGAMVATDW